MRRRGDPLPWERRQGEPAKTYMIFQEYLNLAPQDRTFIEVGKITRRYPGGISKLASHWDWKERAAAYDEHLAIIMQESRMRQFEKEAERWAQRQITLRDTEWDLHEKLMDKAKRMLEFPLARAKTDKDGKTTIIEPVKWFMGDVPKIAQTASQLGRLAASMETSRQKIESEVDKELDGILQELEKNLTGDEFRKVVVAIAGKLGVKSPASRDQVSPEVDSGVGSFPES